MKPAAFDYFRAESVEDVLRQLALGEGGAKVIAGGQSFGPMLNMRLATPATLIDLNDLSELAYIRDAGEMLEVGALTRHHQLAESPLVQRRCPLLARAARTIGHYAIRQRGTLGGSLAHADPAAQLPLVAVTLGARIELLSARGRRSLPARDFFVSAMSTALAADEIIHSVRFPPAMAREGSSFQLFNRRRGDFAIVAVAASLALEGEHVARLQLGVGGADAVPRSLAESLQTFVGRVADAAWVEGVARVVQAEVNPAEDGRIEAQYRKELAGTLARQALQRALARARGEMA
jgi:carbon-monoxide dehydrogenase medium subunit